MNILSIVGNLFGMGKGVLEGWQTRKTEKLKSDLEIQRAKTEAKIEKIKTGQHADIAWENTSIEKSGWRADYLTIVLTLPAILCFIPGLASYVSLGFESLKSTPQWYQWAFGIAVGSAFGYRKIADFMSLKKGD